MGKIALEGSKAEHYMFFHISEATGQSNSAEQVSEKMRCRTVYEIADDRGRWMVTERFLAKDRNVQDLDRDAVELRIQAIEINQSALDNRKWFKPLSKTDVSEIRLETGGKAIRIHCCKDGNDVVVFNGYIKKNGSDAGKIAEAELLKKDWEDGKLKVREIPNAYRL